MSREQQCNILFHFDAACDRRHYNASDASVREIAVILQGDGDQVRTSQDIIIHRKYGDCCDSLLYKGSKDDDGLELEVTGWAWNKRIRTKTMMTAMRMRVKGSIVAVQARTLERQTREQSEDCSLNLRGLIY